MKRKIVSLDGIKWDVYHKIPEQSTTLLAFIESGKIAVGDTVTVENKSECPFPLIDGEYCLIFYKDGFHTEDLFSLAECKLLFGDDFSY